jgi:hypothetical protein
MSVAPDEFLAAKGQFFDLEALETDQDDWITAIAVTIEGIAGSDGGGGGRRSADRVAYRILANVRTVRTPPLPTLWIVFPKDRDIKHVNVFHPMIVCPFVGEKLPHLCWGTGTEATWAGRTQAERSLANLLEAAQQVLAHANKDSRAR